MRAVVAFCVFALVASAFAMPSSYKRTETYEGHKVFRCHFPKRADSDALYDLVHAFGLDVWTHRVNGEIDVRLTPAQQSSVFLSTFFGEKCEVHIKDVEEHVVQAEMQWAAVPKNAEWFEDYHTYDEIVLWYSQRPAAYPTLATYIPSIGRSYEGRNQPALHITSSRGVNKPKIYFQCQIHAREHISGAVCNYVVNHLLNGYGNDTQITNLLDSIEYIVVPFVNPDGYVHTWSGDRLWRKNRQPNSGSTCIGTDVNRNYNSHWGQGGSSALPCSVSPFSFSFPKTNKNKIKQKQTKKQKQKTKNNRIEL